MLCLVLAKLQAGLKPVRKFGWVPSSKYIRLGYLELLALFLMNPNLFEEEDELVWVDSEHDVKVHHELYVRLLLNPIRYP